MTFAGVRCRANVFSSRKSPEDHSRLATRLFDAISDLHRLLVAFYGVLWLKSDNQAPRNSNRKIVNVW
jgi:hypothetical protein